MGAPLPSELSRYETFLSKSEISDVELYDRNIGYFDTAEAADVIRERILPKFPNARVVDLSTVTKVVGRRAATRCSAGAACKATTTRGYGTASAGTESADCATGPRCPLRARRR